MDETCKEVASSACGEAVLEPGQDFVSAAGTDMTPEEEFLSSILSGQDLSALVDPEEERRKHEEYLESLTPGEREAYFERQALETVFADIRSRSRAGELTTEEYWEAAGLTPEHMEPVEFTDLVFDTIIEAQDHENDAAADVDFGDCSSEPSDPEDDAWHLDDIKVLEGTAVYLYSSDMMSESFAHWAFLAAEDDDVMTLVDNARNESKIYPRPLKAASLKNRPVYMTDERIDEAFRIAQESGLYPDIKSCSASNGDGYFYSTDYLSDAQAKALAEWESVERRANM